MMLTIFKTTEERAKNPIIEADFHYLGKANDEIPGQISSKGELLWNFIEYYLFQRFWDSKHRISFASENLPILRFVLRVLLPLIAGEMYKHKSAEIRRSHARTIVINFLEKCRNNQGVLSVLENISGFTGKLIKLNDRYETLKFSDRALSIFVHETRFLYASGQSLFFIHEDFRDFFVASHFINEAKIAKHTKVFPDTWRTSPISFTIRKYIGEITGEIYNRPLIKSNQWNIDNYTPTELKELLNLLRNNFDPIEVGYGIWNILTIWKESRGELSGEDLGNLYLVDYPFNGMVLGRKSGNSVLAVNFRGSRINFDNFLPGVVKQPQCIAFQKDLSTFYIGCEDHSIHEFSIATNSWKKTFNGHTGAVNAIDINHEDQQILSGGQDKAIFIWDPNNHTPVRRFQKHEYSIVAIYYLATDRKVVSISSEDQWITENNIQRVIPVGSEIIMWNYDQPDKYQVLFRGIKGKQIVDHAISNDRSLLSIITQDSHRMGLILEYSLHTGKLHREYNSSCRINSFAYSHDNHKIIIADGDKIVLINRSDGTIEKPNIALPYSVDYLHPLTNGKHLLIGSEWSLQHVALVDINDGAVIRKFEKKSQFPNNTISIDQSEKFVCTLSRSNEVKLYSIDVPELVIKSRSTSSELNCITFSATGTRFFLGANNREVTEWAPNIRLQRSYLGHIAGINCICLSSDDKFLFSGSNDGTVTKWSTLTGERLASYQFSENEKLNALTISNDDQFLICGLFRMIVKIAAETMQILQSRFLEDSDKKMAEGGGKLSGVDFSSIDMFQDNRRFVTGSRDGFVRIWDLDTLYVIIEFKAARVINSLCISPDQSKIVTAAINGEVKEWLVSDGTLTQTYERSTPYAGFSPVTYSPDGKHLVSSWYGIKTWHVSTGKLIWNAQYNTHITDIAFHPSSEFFLTCDLKMNVNAFDTRTGQRLYHKFIISGMNLSGCIMTKLHKDSETSLFFYQSLYQAGAVIDDAYIKHLSFGQRILHKLSKLFKR